ncbi:MAG TPA: ferritin-like domain-containing protein [Longimicrobium sp.]|nr:ferritin-like domain-containing protein [Longimicrobium sp.]
MAASSMKDLLKHELGDLLYAEQLILKMLGTLTREVKNPEVLNRVQEHIGETEEQIQRLRRAFEAVGEKAKAETCEAAVGLKAEHDSFKKDENPSKLLLEAFDLGNSLRVEHYEIAGYRSAIAVATAMGEREVAALLGESLREEEAMATFIERNSVKMLKALGTGMDLATGAAEVRFTAADGASARKSGGSSKKSKSSGSSSRSASASRSSKSNGRGTADTGSGSRSASGGGSRSSSSRSASSKSNGASKSSGGSKSSSGGSSRSASRSSGGSSSSRTTADRSSGSRGGKSGGSSSRSGGSSSKGGGGKSGSSSRSGGSRGSSGSARA